MPDLRDKISRVAVAVVGFFVRLLGGWRTPKRSNDDEQESRFG